MTDSRTGLSDRELNQASDALIEWFKSQGICPAEGAIVMSDTIAIQLVAKTSDPIMLQLAVDNVRQLLECDVVLHLGRKL